jgi:lysophospholipase L1-like esterase
VKLCTGLLFLALYAQAQSAAPDAAVLPPQDVNQFCGRMTELMEAGGVAISELQRAAAPVIENVKQSCIQLQLRPGRSQPTYLLLMNLRAYLALADAVPKPFPFPDAAQRQFTELRDGATRLDAHFRALIDARDRQLVSPDPANLARYAEANRRLAAPNPSKPRVIFFGDSITDYWRLNEYFPDRDFVNRGIAGQTTGQMLQRFKADVIDLHPIAVLILAGTNDLAREIPAAAIENNYQEMADLASANKIKLIFASVLPVSDYHKDQDPAYERTPGRPPSSIRALNDWLQSFCTQRNCVYLNYFPAMIDDKGQLQTDISEDGLHPNSKGYRIMGPLASAAIEKVTGPPPPEPAKPKKRLFPSIIK